MSDFEFFFSFYGLILGLSIVEIVGGVARTFSERAGIKHAHAVLTPLLAAFVAMDVANYWVRAWVDFRTVHIHYGVLLAGLSLSGLYYIAASLVFPKELSEWKSLDEHFWARRRVVLLCLLVCATVVDGFQVAAAWGQLPVAFFATNALYVSCVLAAAFAGRRWQVVAALSGGIVLYLTYAVLAFVRAAQGAG